MSLTGLNILIVEDDLDLLLYYKKVLSKHNAMINHAQNGIQAFDKLKENRVVHNLIITDLEMPISTGWDLLDILKESVDYKEIPVIIISSVPYDIFKSKTTAWKEYTYIEKPVTPDTLLNSVVGIIKNPKV